MSAPNEVRSDARWQAEARVILNVHFCATCNCDTMPLDTTGCCAFCEAQLLPPTPRSERLKDAASGRFVPPPLPVPAPVAKGCCLNCGVLMPIGRRYKALYCGAACKQSFWVKYTEPGRAWVRRHNGQHKHLRKDVA